MFDDLPPPNDLEWRLKRMELVQARTGKLVLEHDEWIAKWEKAARRVRVSTIWLWSNKGSVMTSTVLVASVITGKVAEIATLLLTILQKAP